MSTVALLWSIYFTEILAPFSTGIFYKNFLNVACCTLGNLETRILTPNRFENKTNDNLKLLRDNRNHLQGFLKQKVAAVHCCCLWMEHLLLKFITIFDFKLTRHKEGLLHKKVSLSIVLVWSSQKASLWSLFCAKVMNAVVVIGNENKIWSNDYVSTTTVL